MNILININGRFCCPHCKQSDIKHDYKRCESYCVNCGLICIDNTFVNSAGVRLYDVEVTKIIKNERSKN